ncbi:MAG: Hsp70 family protein [Anaerolineales bacterium]|nr:Hsp70 family protein [Anaerolineales bacterium]
MATKNYGFALFQAVEQAKCELSEQAASTVALQMAAIQLAVALMREEFNRLMAVERAEVNVVYVVMVAAGLKPEQIDVVVATGGSSSILAFQELLRREIPGAEIVVSDLFGSVTGGLAMQAHQRQLVSI